MRAEAPLLSRVRRRGPRAAPSASPTLAAFGIEVNFDGVRALDGVDLTVRRGEVLGLIGPNGAGKTTLVNVLTGFQPPDRGRVEAMGEDVTRLAPRRHPRLGIGRTFQSGRYFGRLTVRENVEAAPVGLGSMSRAAARERAEWALELLGLSEKGDASAGSLSHGDERRLGIARAIAMRPTFLLLDEPAAGLNERESRELVATVARFPRELECGVIVIDHDMHVIMNLCERIQVLDQGRTISVGTPSEVRADPAVLKAYLGTGSDTDDAAD